MTEEMYEVGTEKKKVGRWDELKPSRHYRKPGDGSIAAIDWLASIAITVFCVVLVFTFIVRLVGVKGSSMVDTLHDGDRLFITNLFYTPTVGDIVVVSRDTINDPDVLTQKQEPIIKRVIAVGGQTVDMKTDNSGVVHLYVDGEEKVEDYINGQMRTYYTQTVEFPYEVPEGYVFVMGDNRNNSHDSRAYNVGAIDTRYILGKVLIRVYPFNVIGDPDHE